MMENINKQLGEILEEDGLDEKKDYKIYETPAFTEFLSEAGEEKAKVFLDLMGERDLQLFVLHAGYRNGARFIFHAGPNESWGFINNLEPERMADKIIEAGKIIKGKLDFATDAGEFVYLFGPEGAAELMNLFGAEKIKEHLSKIVFMKKNGSSVEQIEGLLNN